jgi:PPM family protein phosphatase
VTYLAVSALSHIGAVRDHHEDSLVAGPWTLCAAVTESPQTLVFPLAAPVVIAVADGLGGHAGGEVASALVAGRLAQVGPLLDGEDRLREVLSACNQEVYTVAARDPELTGMGTTVAGVVVTADQVLVFNVGDSRVYASGPGGVRQLSTDDRLGDDALPAGIVTQALGGSDEMAPVDPHVVTSPFSEDTSYLICTDGLTDPLPAGVLEDVLREHEDGRALFELWKAAVEAGGPDNITIALVRPGT